MGKGKIFNFNMFTLHIHEDPGVKVEEFEYDKFFSFLKDQRDSIEKKRTITAIAEVFERQESIVLKVVSGERDEKVLEYKSNGSLNEIEPAPDSTFVHDTYLIYFKNTRQLAIQNSRPGVSKDNLLHFLESYLRLFTKNQYSTLFMQPVFSEDFVKEVNKLTRIQSAQITLKLPNPSFLDSQQQLLAELAHSSNAQKQEIKLTAPRGKSLEKNSGIVQIIKEASSENIKSVDSFSVRGKHPDSESEKTIRSKDYLAKASEKIYDEKDSGPFISSLVGIAKKLLKYA